VTFRSAVRSLAGRAADIVWPRICPATGCGRASDRADRSICSRCFAALPYYDRPADGIHAHALVYMPPVDEMILDFKFHKAIWLADDFVDLLEGTVRGMLDADAIDAVLPVPLHPNRLRERGYNQSALLARGLARRLDRRYDARSLLRIRDTLHQTRVDGSDREKNVAGAFIVRDPALVRGRTVLLVDDVMTTGATAQACFRALEKAGATRVLFASVAVREEI